MTAILTGISNPEEFTDGNWPRAHMNGDAGNGIWRFPFTHTNATQADWGAYFGRPTGGLWRTSSNTIELYDTSDNLIISRSVTISAGQTGTFTINDNTGAGNLTIAGLTAGNGSFSFTAADIFTSGTLKAGGVPGVSGFTIAGSFGDMDDTQTGYTITAESGSVAITGTAASTLVGRKVTADAGSYALTGTAANLLVGHRIVCDSGSVAITGTNAELTLSSSDPILDAEPGAVAITGTAAGLLAARRLSAEAGAYAIGGTDAGLSKGLRLTCESGAVALTGTDAAVRVGRRVDAQAGAVTITGTDANLQYGTIGVGAHGYVQQNYGSGSNPAQVTLSTQASGSSFLLGMGGRITDIDNGPSDNHSNAYSQIGSITDYTDWANYGTAMWWARQGAGGAGHTFSQFVTTSDEITVFALELKGVQRLHTQSFSQRGNTGATSTQTSGSVTTSQASILVAFWWGSGPAAGQNHSASPNNGFQLLDFFGTDNPQGYVQGGVAYRYAATPGTYDVTWTHSPVQGAQLWLLAFEAPLTVSAEPGSVAITGTDVALRRGLKVSADPGSVAVTGTNATLTLGKVLSAESGAVAVTGTDATLATGRRISCDPGAVASSGVDANLLVGRRMAADVGAFALTGVDASLAIGRRLVADAGAVAITGVDANLVKTGSHILTAEAGAFALAGADASLLYGRRLTADAGAVDVVGVDVSLLAGRRMSADAGDVALAGVAAALLTGRLLTAQTGAITITGVDATLRYGNGDSVYPFELSVALEDTAYGTELDDPAWGVS